MNNANKGLEQSALVMRLLGWVLIIGMALAVFVYSPGFLWGMLPAGFPQIGPAHPESPYDALHPYILMLAVVYLAWAILMIRGASDPKANAALFDFGILANLSARVGHDPAGVHLPQRACTPMGGYTASVRSVRNPLDLASQQSSPTNVDENDERPRRRCSCYWQRVRRQHLGQPLGVGGAQSPGVGTWSVARFTTRPLHGYRETSAVSVRHEGLSRICCEPFTSAAGA